MMVAELPKRSVRTAPSSEAVISTRSGGSSSSCANAGVAADASPTHGTTSFVKNVLVFIISTGVLRQRSTRLTAARTSLQRYARTSASTRCIRAGRSTPTAAQGRLVARRILRALNSPGSGMSDAHRPVYWLRGSTRHARPSQELSQWLRPLSGRWLRMRSPLQLQGQPSFRPHRPSLRSRGALSGTGAPNESRNRETHGANVLPPRPCGQEVGRGGYFFEGTRMARRIRCGAGATFPP